MSEPFPLFEIRCIFCKRIHRSEFFDEIEDGILSCRDAAPKWQRGDLDQFEESHIITVETAVNQEDPLSLGVGGP